MKPPSLNKDFKNIQGLYMESIEPQEEGTDGETSDLTEREKFLLAKKAGEKGKGPLAKEQAPVDGADPQLAADEATVQAIAALIDQSKLDPAASAPDLLSQVAQALNPTAGQELGSIAAVSAPPLEKQVEPVGQSYAPLEEEGDPEEENDDDGSDDSWAGYDKENSEGKGWKDVDGDKDPGISLGGPTGHLSSNINPPSILKEDMDDLFNI